jgi:RNA polymerase sigma-70 factor, ECF subfamily
MKANHAPSWASLGSVRLRARPDEGVLRNVYRRNVDAVYAFFAYSVSRETAEDLTSATFERVVRSWGSYDPRRGNERTWILRIARNLLVDHFRRSSRRQSTSLDEHPALLDALITSEETAHQRVTTAEGFFALLSRLTPRDRDVIALRYGAD